MTPTPAPRRPLLAGTALAALAIAAPAGAVVPNETTTPEAIVDTGDAFRGVGIFYRDDGGICTGTLINPRTVIFAAHCVNDRPATDYRVDAIPAAFAFEADAFPGLVDWVVSGYASNPDRAVFTVGRIFYDPRSLEDAVGARFLEADIALASLDTPAAGIPTWALLFSTLPAPATSDPARGTGYHVNIVGYGRSGNAVQGAVRAIDFRRRAAENMLGGFFSLDDQDRVLFGARPDTIPQNLYQLDFDSQDRRPFADINIHRDNALPNEGITAGGDSGGPLILDAANNRLAAEDLVIGVLSGGSRITQVGQQFSAFGASSFYQPLSLFWDYIAATNPYRYVGARAGDGAWEDPRRWVTLLDPGYRVIDAGGRVVNGLPDTPALGTNGTGGDFGAICAEFEQPGDACVNLATGALIRTGTPPGAVGAGLTNAVARVTLTEGGIIAADNAAAPGTLRAAPQAETASLPAAAALPAPSLANGLPGASGFVPDNVDPVVSADPGVNVDPRYFDVTLSQAGTTTLSSRVTIDRLTMRGSAGLTVGAAGDLRTLIDVNQFGGRVNLLGELASAGDYTLFAGMIEGTGTITAPFLTSVAGVLSPASMGTTGTLAIDGNLVLASGSILLVDLGPGGASDRLAVTGIADVGGVVGIGSGVTARVNGQGERYTILTAAGGVSGTFSARAISPILAQSFIYRPDAVLMEVTAASYATVIDRADPVQAAYAQLFDQNRANARLAALYALDFAEAPAIRAAFARLAPVNEQAVRGLAAQAINGLQNAVAARLREADRARSGGRIAVTGRPLELAQTGFGPGLGRAAAGAAALALQEDGASDTAPVAANLPDNVALFLAGGLVSGDVAALPGYGAGREVGGQFIARETEFSGWHLTGGAEFYPGERTMVGVSGYAGSLEADVPLGQQVRSDTYAASLYLRHGLVGGAVLAGQFSMGSMGFDTRRTVALAGGAGETLEASSDDLLVSGAIGLSWDLATGIGTISPGVEARHASVALTRPRESGGTLALAYERETFRTTQLRLGADWAAEGKAAALHARAQIVRELEDGPQLLAANFAEGIGPDAAFVLAGPDRTWGELGVAASFGTGPLTASFGIDTTIGRSTAEARVVRAAATWRF